jgi:hypothetical protein
MELFGTWVGTGVEVCIGVPVPFAVTLAHPVSYCDGAPALLYACPPVPPLRLLPVKGPLVVLVGGSLNTEPGDVPALPG